MHSSFSSLWARDSKSRTVSVSVALVFCAMVSGQSTLAIERAAQQVGWGREMEWYQIENKAANLLSAAQDKKALVLKLNQAAARNGLQDELILLDVLIRLGYSADATNAVRKFNDGNRAKIAAADPARGRLLESAADFLIGKKEFSAATALVEKFPESTPAYGPQLVKYLAQTTGNAKTDDWLISLAKASPNEDYWLEQRIRWKSDNLAAQPLFDQMLTQVKLDPSNFIKAMRFVHMANAVYKDRPNLDELANILRPKFAYECFLLGLELQTNSPKSAAALYERSLSLPFTLIDKKEFSAYVKSHWALAYLPRDNEWGTWLRQSTKNNLVESYMKSKQIAKAQKLMVELSNTKPGGLPGLSLSSVAGAIQAQSDVHPIEARIRAAEPENKQSCDYWIGRASYYYGRKNKPDMVAAYERAFALCSIDTETGEYKRAGMINSYRREYLLLGGSEHDVSQLLEREYKLAVPGTYYMTSVLSEIRACDKRENLDNLLRDDNKVWEHLKRKKAWTLSDCEVIVEIIKLASSSNAATVWNRASALTENADASKAFWLADAMRRSNRCDLASKMYQRAIDGASKILAGLRPDNLSDLDKKVVSGNLLDMAQMDLFSCYIQLDDWKSAEGIYNKRATSAHADSKSSDLAQLALAAARAGAKEQSMRFWQAHSAIDRGSLGWLREIAEAGMKQELTAYYQKLSKDDPKSTAPAAALKILSAIGS
ncbi:MAG: hypothetical protein JST89_00410 [Cyanobacteria bacterium SZAS-4]|nr:hypothetical protein [Cyanobacteria bacterium SZAS-4]